MPKCQNSKFGRSRPAIASSKLALPFWNDSPPAKITRKTSSSFASGRKVSKSTPRGVIAILSGAKPRSRKLFAAKATVPRLGRPQHIQRSRNWGRGRRRYEPLPMAGVFGVQHRHLWHMWTEERCSLWPPQERGHSAYCADSTQQNRQKYPYPRGSTGPPPHRKASPAGRQHDGG